MELMNLNASQSLTMSSREISVLCEKQHQHVKRDTENMLVELEIDVSSFGRIYLDSMNRKQTEYCLPKDLTLTLVAGYNVKLRKRIIDRWLELEQQVASPSLPNFQDPVAAARAWADAKEGQLVAEQKATQLENKVIELAPKAAVADRIVTVSEGAMNVTLAAKTLQVQPKALFTWLSAHRWIYRRVGGSSWVAYQDKIQQGLLQHKVTTVERTDGTEKVVEQVLVTAKGLAKLAGELGPICA